MDDSTPIGVTVEACGVSHKRFRWYLTDADGVSIRVSPESYGSPEEADEAGWAALNAFGAALNE